MGCISTWQDSDPHKGIHLDVGQKSLRAELACKTSSSAFSPPVKQNPTHSYNCFYLLNFTYNTLFILQQDTAIASLGWHYVQFLLSWDLMLGKLTTKSILLLAKGIHSSMQAGSNFKLLFLSICELNWKWNSINRCNDTSELAERPKTT